MLLPNGDRIQDARKRFIRLKDHEVGLFKRIGIQRYGRHFLVSFEPKRRDSPFGHHGAYVGHC